MPTKDDALPLEGWISLIELARRLGISRQAVHQHADNGRISSLRYIRTADRPVWIVEEAEIPDLRDRLAAARPGAASNTGHDDNGQSHEAPEQASAC